MPTRYEAGGIEPRALAFDAGGNHLYVTNVFTNSVTLFDFDDEKGELQARRLAATISTPTDIKFLIDANYNARRQSDLNRKRGGLQVQRMRNSVIRKNGVPD